MNKCKKRDGKKERCFCGIIFIAIFCSSACKKEEKLPEHVVWLQKKKEERERLIAANKSLQQQDKSSKTQLNDVSVDDTKWPIEVQRAFQLAYKANALTTPQATRQLAWLGFKAVPAMQYLIHKKTESKEKQVALSFLLAEMYMFRPEDLAKIVKETDSIFLKRAAIERLMRFEDTESEKLLNNLLQQEKFLGSLVEKRQKIGQWDLTKEQRFLLDKILHAQTLEECREHLSKVDLRYEDKLLLIVASPVTRPSIQGAIVGKIVELNSNNTKKLRMFCSPQYPFLLRVVAAQMLKKQDKGFRKYLARLAANPKDPAASFFKKILEGSLPSTAESW